MFHIFYIFINKPWVKNITCKVWIILELNSNVTFQSMFFWRGFVLMGNNFIIFVHKSRLPLLEQVEEVWDRPLRKDNDTATKSSGNSLRTWRLAKLGICLEEGQFFSGLTHWYWVTSWKLITIGSGNGLVTCWYQAIASTNVVPAFP